MTIADHLVKDYHWVDCPRLMELEAHGERLSLGGGPSFMAEAIHWVEASIHWQETNHWVCMVGQFGHKLAAITEQVYHSVVAQ